MAPARLVAGRRSVRIRTRAGSRDRDFGLARVVAGGGGAEDDPGKSHNHLRKQATENALMKKDYRTVFVTDARACFLLESRARAHTRPRNLHHAASKHSTPNVVPHGATRCTGLELPTVHEDNVVQRGATVQRLLSRAAAHCVRESVLRSEQAEQAAVPHGAIRLEAQVRVRSSECPCVPMRAHECP